MVMNSDAFRQGGIWLLNMLFSDDECMHLCSMELVENFLTIF